MKKFVLLFCIISMVVLDLMLRGESVLLGLIILAVSGLICYALDNAQSEETAAKSTKKAEKWDSKYVTKQLSATF